MQLVLARGSRHQIERDLSALARLQIAQHPRCLPCALVVEPAGRHRLILEPRRHRPVQDHVGRRRTARVGHLHDIRRLAVDVPQLGAGDRQVQLGQQDFQGGVVGGAEAAIARRHDQTLVRSAATRRAHQLQRAGFPGGERAEAHLNGPAGRMLQALRQQRLELDAVGRPVAGVADRKQQRDRLAGQHLFGRLHLHEQLRLADLHLMRSRSAERDRGLGRQPPLDLRHDLQIDTADLTRGYCAQ